METGLEYPMSLRWSYLLHKYIRVVEPGVLALDDGICIPTVPMISREETFT